MKADTASQPIPRMNAAAAAKRYDHIKTIGKGSYGTVDLVRNKTDHKLWVMKDVAYSPPNAKEKSAAQREVDMLRMLHHPNIVELKEAFITDDEARMSIVMGYCEGGDLMHRIRRFRKQREYIHEDQIMEWFVQICMALAYLHDRHVLHRDIKPHNVFLTNNARVVKVGDFGVTRILNHTGSMAKTTIGTPYYASPEICKNVKYNTKSDIWALGVMLYEMCALHVPFDAANFRELRKKIVYTHPSPLSPHFSRALRELVADMLVKEPEARPDVRSILRRPLCQKHLRLLMKRHSRPKPLVKPSSTDTADADAAASKLQAKLDKKKAALAVARADAKEAASGAIKLDPRDIALSNAKKADILTPALAAAGGEARAAEVRVLEREVEHVEQQLEQKSLEVHAAVIASQHEADLAEMTMLAGTLADPRSDGAAAAAGGGGGGGAGGGAGAGAGAGARAASDGKVGDMDSDEDMESDGKRREKELSSLGKEVVRQVSTGKLHLTVDEVNSNAGISSPHNGMAGGTSSDIDMDGGAAAAARAARGGAGAGGGGGGSRAPSSDSRSRRKSGKPAPVDLVHAGRALFATSQNSPTMAGLVDADPPRSTSRRNSSRSSTRRRMPSSSSSRQHLHADAHYESHSDSKHVEVHRLPAHNSSRLPKLSSSHLDGGHGTGHHGGTGHRSHHHHSSHHHSSHHHHHHYNDGEDHPGAGNTSARSASRAYGYPRSRGGFADIDGPHAHMPAHGGGGAPVKASSHVGGGGGGTGMPAPKTRLPSFPRRTTSTEEMLPVSGRSRASSRGSLASGRPLTAGSDFTEGLDGDLLHSVRQQEASLMPTPRLRTSSSRSSLTPRRRPEAIRNLQPLQR